jgi:hypothetical protein
VGSAGIRRRRKRRPKNASPEARISEGDVNRLFGRFTWDAYTPAGNLERNGFLWRQLGRRKRDGWTIVAYALFAIFVIPILLGLIAMIVDVVR